MCIRDSVNALAGKTVMDTAAIREDDSRGRHTTTHRQLLMLPGGAMAIDTPGMREIGMWDAEEGLSGAFSDVEDFLGRCKDVYKRQAMCPASSPGDEKAAATWRRPSSTPCFTWLFPGSERVFPNRNSVKLPQTDAAI